MSDKKIKHTERPPVSRSTRTATPPAPQLSKETLADFSQVITHRIGNLLSGIEGYTDLILSSLHSPDDRENAFRILESVSRINGVLRDLNHYEDLLELSKHLVGAKLISSELTHLLADSEAQRLRVTHELPEDVLIDADDRLIRQALLSILRNAFEATRSDKLVVSLDVDCIHESKTVRFRIFSPVSIEDETIRKQIFNPFFTTKAANLGLGLTMARRIFRAHDGDVKLTSSELTTGTEFTCTIPSALA